MYVCIHIRLKREIPFFCFSFVQTFSFLRRKLKQIRRKFEVTEILKRHNFEIALDLNGKSPFFPFLTMQIRNMWRKLKQKLSNFEITEILKRRNYIANIFLWLYPINLFSLSRSLTRQYTTKKFFCNPCFKISIFKLLSWQLWLYYIAAIKRKSTFN